MDGSTADNAALNLILIYIIFYFEQKKDQHQCIDKRRLIISDEQIISDERNTN
jgi:hypothetical protein